MEEYTPLSWYASIIDREVHSELKSFPVPQPEPFGEQLSDDGQGTSTSGYHCFPSGVKSTDNIEHYIFHLPLSFFMNCDYNFSPACRATHCEFKHFHSSAEANNANRRGWGAKQPGTGQIASRERQEDPVPGGQDTTAHPGWLQLSDLGYNN